MDSKSVLFFFNNVDCAILSVWHDPVFVSLSVPSQVPQGRPIAHATDVTGRCHLKSKRKEKTFFFF
jgi:hypothetical protein